MRPHRPGSRRGIDPEARTHSVGTGIDPNAPTASDDTPAGSALRATEAAERAELEAGDEVGKFTIVRRLGAGGMGVVYEARDEVLARLVALKLVRLGGDDEPRAQRVLREARAAAGLTHPNVVAVYEVGTSARGPYIAMEYVDGKSAGDWLAAGERTWRDVLAVYLQAAEGLAAAHDAGLVHCDVKPDNILVGADRVWVADFGIARVAGRDGAGTANKPAPVAKTISATGSGSVAGTPRYMAPEQWEGQADARSDQYGLCAALLEALGGALPERGRQVAIDPKTPAPLWLQRVLIRGMSVNPDNRYPDMRALIGALRADPGRRWRRAGLLAGVVGLAGVAAAAGAWAFGGEASRCRGFEQDVARVWNAERRAAIEAAFGASGRPYAGPLAARFVEQLDRHTEAWVEARTEACVATERGAQSPALLDKRMRCLDRQLDRVRAVVDVFSDADADAVDRAADVIDRLGRDDPCSDLEALDAAVPLPGDPAARARVLAFDRELADIEALLDTEAADEAARRLDAVTAEIRALGHPPLLSSLLWHQGRLERRRRDDPAAEATLRELTRVASASKHDRMALRAWTSLIYVIGTRQARYDDALALVPAAEAALARAEDAHPDLRADLYHTIAHIHRRRGDIAEAERLYRLSIAIAEEHLGPKAPQLASTLNMYGMLLRQTGRYEDAAAALRRALDIRLEHYGNGHPATSSIYQNLGALSVDEHRLDDARGYFERALEGYRAAFGADHPAVGANLENLASLELAAGRPREAAVQYERALEVQAARLAKGHPSLAATRAKLGVARFRAGDPEGGLEACTASRAAFEASGARTIDHGTALSCIGKISMAQGRSDDAVVIFEEALRLLTSIDAAPRFVASAKAELGAALWESGRDRRRAVALTREALDGASPALRPQLEEVLRDWGAATR